MLKIFGIACACFALLTLLVYSFLTKNSPKPVQPPLPPAIAAALEQIVTPGTPASVCDYVFIDFEDTKVKKATLITLTEINKPDFKFSRDRVSIAVDLKYLREFVRFVNFNLKARIVAVIGRHNIHESQLPYTFQNRDWLNFLVQHPLVLHVFMQNPELSRTTPKFSAFPYGVHEDTAADLVHEINKVRKKPGFHKTNLLFVSPIRFGNHKQYRPAWFPTTIQVMPYAKYMSEMRKSYFATSPGGDRYDCFRHYEAIAMQTVPVTNLPSHLYGDLFHGIMVMNVQKSGDIFDRVVHDSWAKNKWRERVKASRILSVEYWRQIVKNATK